MNVQDLLKGRFTYGPRGAVDLVVKNVEAPSPTLVPVRDPFDRATGRPDVLQLPAAYVNKMAARAGLTPLAVGHFLIAYNAAKLAVGRAIPAFDAGFLDAPTVWEQVNGDISDEQRGRRRVDRDLLAIEMAGSLARRHPAPADRNDLEALRYALLTAAGLVMDGPLTRDVHARISGDVGERVTKEIHGRILPWFRDNIRDLSKMG